MIEIISTMKKLFKEGNASPDSAEEFFYFVSHHLAFSIITIIIANS